MHVSSFSSMSRPHPTSTLFPYTTLFRSLLERKEDYARDMTREMGKILNETRGDVQEAVDTGYYMAGEGRSEEHTSELQSHHDLVCRLLLEKKKTNIRHINRTSAYIRPPL